MISKSFLAMTFTILEQFLDSHDYYTDEMNKKRKTSVLPKKF